MTRKEKIDKIMELFDAMSPERQKEILAIAEHMIMGGDKDE